MCSITPSDAGPVTVAALGAAIDHLEQLVDGLARALADASRIDLGAVQADVAAQFTTALLRVGDRSAAAATVMAGHVITAAGPATGSLIAGRFASPRRWLEVDAGLSASHATAVIARGRDLREHSAVVGSAWLAGQLTGDAVRELTSGVSGALTTVSAPRAEKERLRAEALELLLPVATAGTVADVRRSVHRLRLLAESAYEAPEREAARAQAAVDAYDEQALTCVAVGDHSIITATLTHESAAAAMTVITQYADRIADRDLDVAHDPTCPLAARGAASSGCTCGARAAARAPRKGNQPHLRAVAFAELMSNQLDDGKVGSHHGIAPHVSLQVDLEQLHAGLGGALAMPGSDEPVLLGSQTVRRLLCDTSITPVVVEKPCDVADPAGPARLARLLMATAVTVLYVGRAERTATPRQRRALEARDRHCVFPDCRAHPRRCQAHHVTEWEHGGPTDLDNLVLLCRRHHVAVHEGGWTLTRAPGVGAHETGCWTLTPPRPQP